MAWKGTRIALALPCNCPLCSAVSTHEPTMTMKQLQSRKVCHIGSTNLCCELRQTKSSSQQNVLLSPISGSCSNTAFSNSWRRSNSWSSIVSWVSSPANVANIKQMVIDLSSLHCEVDTEMWSAITVKSSLRSNAHLFSSQKVLRQTSIRLTFLAAATGC